MIDVFVVAFMVALVQMGTLMTVSPGPGATFFAGVVVLTMVSAHALDTRLLWDKSRL
jgi:paraquat-inducible protein A